MSLGLRDERRRRRYRARLTLLRGLVILALVAGVGVYAYQTGSRVAERGIASRDEQIRQLSVRVEELQAQVQAHQVDLAAERGNAEAWRQRYERDVATGDARELAKMLQAKIAEGVDAHRLRWVLEHIQARRVCDPRPQVRRVPVRTPSSRGGPSPIALAGGALSISLSAEAVPPPAGAREARYDPKLPVTVRLTAASGRTMESEGVLPQQRSFVEGDREYQLTVAPGPAGFATVTVERCRFP